MTSLPNGVALRGRVFARRQVFIALPALEQQRVQALATFLDESHAFRMCRVGFRNTVVGISCGKLEDIVREYVDKHPQLLERPSPVHHQQQEQQPDSRVYAARVAIVPTRSRKQVVRSLIDNLVLSGMLAIYNEHKEPTLASKLSDFARPKTIFVPTTTPLATDNDSSRRLVSVWNLRDVVILANTFPRTSKLSSVRPGRKTYFVVDGTHKRLYWFASDSATEAEGSISLAGATIQSNGPGLVNLPDFHVKVTCATTRTSVSMFSTHVADWINPMLRCGAIYSFQRLTTQRKAAYLIGSIWYI